MLLVRFGMFYLKCRMEVEESKECFALLVIYDCTTHHWKPKVPYTYLLIWR